MVFLFLGACRFVRGQICAIFYDHLSLGEWIYTEACSPSGLPGCFAAVSSAVQLRFLRLLGAPPHMRVAFCLARLSLAPACEANQLRTGLWFKLLSHRHRNLPALPLRTGCRNRMSQSLHRSAALSSREGRVQRRPPRRKHQFTLLVMGCRNL